MPPDQLDNLVTVGQLKAEPPADQEVAGLIKSGLARLRDASNDSLSIESRFDLAYNAAHALSLAALRKAWVSLGESLPSIPMPKTHARPSERAMANTGSGTP